MEEIVNWNSKNASLSLIGFLIIGMKESVSLKRYKWINRQKRKSDFLSRNKKTLYPDIQHWFFENSQVSKRRYSGFSSQKFEFSTCCFFHLEDSVKLSAMLQLKSFAMVIVCMCHWSNAAAACKPRRTMSKNKKSRSKMKED